MESAAHMIWNFIIAFVMTLRRLHNASVCVWLHTWFPSIHTRHSPFTFINCLTLFHSIPSSIYPENFSAYLHFLVYTTAPPTFNRKTTLLLPQMLQRQPYFAKVLHKLTFFSSLFAFLFFFLFAVFLLMPLIHFSFYDHRVDSLRVLVRALA